MVHRVAAAAGCFDRDRQVFFDFGLAREVREAAGPEGSFELLFLIAGGGRNDAVGAHEPLSVAIPVLTCRIVLRGSSRRLRCLVYTAELDGDLPVRSLRSRRIRSKS